MAKAERHERRGGGDTGREGLDQGGVRAQRPEKARALSAEKGAQLRTTPSCFRGSEGADGSVPRPGLLTGTVPHPGAGSRDETSILRAPQVHAVAPLLCSPLLQPRGLGWAGESRATASLMTQF